MTRIGASGSINVAGADVLHRLAAHALANGFHNEFGNIAFSHALRAEKGAQRGIGFFGDGDGPAGAV